jgi:hypothetical protein
MVFAGDVSSEAGIHPETADRRLNPEPADRQTWVAKIIPARGFRSFDGKLVRRNSVETESGDGKEHKNILM